MNRWTSCRYIQQMQAGLSSGMASWHLSVASRIKYHMLGTFISKLVGPAPT